MPTVKVNEESTQKSVSQQDEEKTVLTDARGRKIALRELDPLQESRIFLAVGADNASNSQYMSGYAFPSAMIEYIDGEYFAIPSNLKQIEARLTILGREGMLAIREYMLKALKDAEEKVGEDSGKEGEQQAAKN